tara:strand:+ start:13 stop:405 length:393 start_codon:yes stop_codon:yes gene_type:complete
MSVESKFYPGHHWALTAEEKKEQARDALIYNLTEDILLVNYVTRAYTELSVSNGKIRVFREDVSESQLVWHMDERDRSFHVIEGYGWMLQRDNEEPVDMLEGHSYSIDKMEYHRILKGDGDLIIRIYEAA